LDFLTPRQGQDQPFRHEASEVDVADCPVQIFSSSNHTAQKGLTFGSLSYPDDPIVPFPTTNLHLHGRKSDSKNSMRRPQVRSPQTLPLQGAS
jgi:hypothetical protein